MPKLTCPDCDAEITEFNVERYQTRKYRIDSENKEFVPCDNAEESPKEAWETNDWAYRCPYCDSLDLDDIVRNILTSDSYKFVSGTNP